MNKDLSDKFVVIKITTISFLLTFTRLLKNGKATGIMALKI